MIFISKITKNLSIFILKVINFVKNHFMEENQFPYQFTVKDFSYNGNQYKVVLTPELYPEESELDFTGNYLGIIISSNKGTQSFELTQDPHTRWEADIKGMDPGIIDELDKIIREIRTN